MEHVQAHGPKEGLDLVQEQNTPEDEALPGEGMGRVELEQEILEEVLATTFAYPN